MSLGDFVVRGDDRSAVSVASSLTVVENFFGEPLTPAVIGTVRRLPREQLVKVSRKPLRQGTRTPSPGD